jgi:ssDNA-binding Zn-finger/Zn-ribbon topoisomerase 1
MEKIEITDTDYKCPMCESDLIDYEAKKESIKHGQLQYDKSQFTSRKEAIQFALRELDILMMVNGFRRFYCQECDLGFEEKEII